MADNSEEMFGRLSEMVVEMNTLLNHNLQITCTFDVFGTTKVVIHDYNKELTEEMTLSEMMDWIEGAYWAVRVLTRSN